MARRVATAAAWTAIAMLDAWDQAEEAWPVEPKTAAFPTYNQVDVENGRRKPEAGQRQRDDDDATPDLVRSVQKMLNMARKA